MGVQRSHQTRPSTAIKESVLWLKLPRLSPRGRREEQNGEKAGRFYDSQHGGILQLIQAVD